MPQFGSNPSVSSQNLSATQDQNGNAIISSDNSFAASPLGVAARTQALYGLPNGHFDLTCPDPDSEVEVNNAIPYWDLEYSGTISTKMVYDATTQNWSVRMDPTGAEEDDYAILKSRTYLLNDDDLALRQKAFARLTKVGTAGTAEWSIVLSATYYDVTGAQLSTYNIGTAADSGTWTGISGVTTSGSAAISTSAAYADIALTLTAAGSVSGTAKVDINSVLIATSQAAGGSSSFLITETFLESGTFTRPTGVDYVSVVAMGGGKGGGSGRLNVSRTTSGGQSTAASVGGATGSWVYLPDIYIGDVGTVSVGIGAGGAGGTANTFSKAAGASGTAAQLTTAGANGGATTFGSYLSVGGGGGTAVTSLYYGAQISLGTAGATPVGGNGVAGNPHSISTFTMGAPFSVAFVSPVVGNAGSGSGGGTANSGDAGTAFAETGLGGSGATGGGAQGSATISVGRGGGGRGGGAAGGGGDARYINATQTIVSNGGDGGNAPANSGGGGGGGGSSAVAASTTANYDASTITATSGKGGDGGSGWLVVAWVG